MLQRTWSLSAFSEIAAVTQRHGQLHETLNTLVGAQQGLVQQAVLTNKRVVGRDEHEATLGHLVDTLCDHKHYNELSVVERARHGTARWCSGHCRHSLSLRLSLV